MNYVNVRRPLFYLKESACEGSQWVVFEANDEPLLAYRNSYPTLVHSLKRDSRFF